jgi:molybdenum cofactor biosynthesis enzyme
MARKPRAKARSVKRRKTATAEMPLRPRKAAAVKGGADPSGNTMYIATAGGGVWKQTERIPFKG